MKVSRPARPIDPRQHIWWHRLRRVGPWAFVLLGGGVLSPLVTCLLFGGVVFYYRYPWSTFVTNGTYMWLTTAPFYIGAWFWTWKHMERRYRAAHGMRCPRCGYSLHGRSASDRAPSARCPECGAVLKEEGVGDGG